MSAELGSGLKMPCRAMPKAAPLQASCTLSGVSMDRQTTFLLALGMLVFAALFVGVSGWVLFARDRALAEVGDSPPSAWPDGAHHREGIEGS